MAFFDLFIPKEIVLKIQGYIENNPDYLNFRKTCRKIYNTYDYHQLMERVQKASVYRFDRFIKENAVIYGNWRDEYFQECLRERYFGRPVDHSLISSSESSSS